MGSKITCGKFNKDFSFIMFTIIFEISNDSLYGFNYNESFVNINLFNNNPLSIQKLNRYLFNYLGTFLICVIIVNINPHKKYGDEKKGLVKYLIYNDAEQRIKTVKVLKKTLIICICWIIQEQGIEILRHILKDLDFWMLELIFISFITKKVFKSQIYSYQIFAFMISCIIPFILKFLTIVLSFSDYKCIDNIDNCSNKIFGIYEGKLPILYVIKKEYLLFVILYALFLFIKSYVYVQIKWLIQNKNIPSINILMIYGIFGSFIISIFLVIAHLLPCYYNDNEIDFNSPITSNQTSLNLFNYICKTCHDTKNTTNRFAYHLDNYYYKNFGYQLIYIIPSGMIIFFLFQYFSILVLEYLSPAHLIFSSPIYYFFEKLISATYTMHSKGRYFFFDIDNNTEKNIKYKKAKYFLDSSGDIIAILGFLIYLEIIELNFCGFSHDIKVNIIKRSFGDTHPNEEDEDISFICNNSQLEIDEEQIKEENEKLK